MDYLIFLRANLRFVGFGFLLTLMSSFGQTYYVALYGAEIRAEFGLGHGGFGAVFSLASIASAVMLIWLGRLIDRVDLRRYTAATLIALLGSMAVLSFAETLWLFGLAIFVVRMCGQGLCIHITGTSMARYFPRDRGKALGLAGLGLASGEALLPITTVALIALLGWRDVWLGTAAAMAVLLAVLMPVVLKGHAHRHREYLERQARIGERDGGARSWTRLEVLRDPRYLGTMALILAYPYIATGALFHQVFIAESKGWSIQLLAGGLVALAVLKVLASLTVGPLIDRRGAARLVPASAIPFIITYVLLGASDHPIVAFVFLGALGVGIGIQQPVFSAMLAELYGTANLGGIRAMSVSAQVLAAAAAPATFGWLFDRGVAVETVSVACAAYVAVAMAVAHFALRPCG